MNYFDILKDENKEKEAGKGPFFKEGTATFGQNICEVTFLSAAKVLELL